MSSEYDAAEDLRARVLRLVGTDNPRDVECPRERSRMTPCVARDGDLAVDDGDRCVGCGWYPSQLLSALGDL